jgi:hypothetical protein
MGVGRQDILFFAAHPNVFSAFLSFNEFEFEMSKFQQTPQTYRAYCASMHQPNESIIYS